LGARGKISVWLLATTVKDAENYQIREMHGRLALTF
jgi:hypothetical protein